MRPEIPLPQHDSAFYEHSAYFLCIHSGELTNPYVSHLFLLALGTEHQHFQDLRENLLNMEGWKYLEITAVAACRVGELWAGGSALRLSRGMGMRC